MLAVMGTDLYLVVGVVMVGCVGWGRGGGSGDGGVCVWGGVGRSGWRGGLPWKQIATVECDCYCKGVPRNGNKLLL